MNKKFVVCAVLVLVSQFLHADNQKKSKVTSKATTKAIPKKTTKSVNAKQRSQIPFDQLLEAAKKVKDKAVYYEVALFIAASLYEGVDYKGEECKPNLAEALKYCFIATNSYATKEEAQKLFNVISMELLMPLASGPSEEEQAEAKEDAVAKKIQEREPPFGMYM